jgi:hypothetical protein
VSSRLNIRSRAGTSAGRARLTRTDEAERKLRQEWKRQKYGAEHSQQQQAGEDWNVWVRGHLAVEREFVFEVIAETNADLRGEMERAFEKKLEQETRKLRGENTELRNFLREGLAELKLKMSEAHLALSQRQTNAERDALARAGTTAELGARIDTLVKRHGLNDDAR